MPVLNEGDDWVPILTRRMAHRAHELGVIPEEERDWHLRQRDRIERQEQRERHTPEIGPRIYRGGGIEADERERVEEVRSWLLVAFVVAIVLAILFAPRGPWWPVP